MNRREQLLTELLSPRRPIELIWEELSQFPWDSKSELVVLKRTHLKAMLDNIIADQLTVADIEAWAEALEGRDDTGLEAGWPCCLAG
jgi:hypothetical protein